MKRYVFSRVSQLNVVTLGISENSQFDFGVSVSALSIKVWDWLAIISKGVVLSLLVATFIYVYIKKLLKALKKRSHSQLNEELEEENEI